MHKVFFEKKSGLGDKLLQVLERARASEEAGYYGEETPRQEYFPKKKRSELLCRISQKRRCSVSNLMFLLPTVSEELLQARCVVTQRDQNEPSDEVPRPLGSGGNRVLVTCTRQFCDGISKTGLLLA